MSFSTSALFFKISSNFFLLLVLCTVAVSTATIRSSLVRHSLTPRHSHYSKRNQHCDSFHHRRAWHNLTSSEKQDYINAELCLMWQRPSRSGLPGARSRFDDLQAIHQIQGDIVHTTGYFLPFHRLLLHAHEYLLTTECNYTGSQPYWDESLSAGRFSEDPIFSPTTGFGGYLQNSSTPLSISSTRISSSNPSQRNRSFPNINKPKCITTGPFATYTLHIGPGMSNTPHCISRFISDTSSILTNKSYVDECLLAPTFIKAWKCIELTPHAGGHSGVGGEMSNSYSSPGDPLFYLHHAWVDKIWWEWQNRDLQKRVLEITGRKTMLQPQNTKDTVGLEDWMRMFGVIEDAKVGDVMDLKGGRMCADYIDTVPGIILK